MSKLKAIWELLRLEHGFMYAFGVVIGMVVVARLSFNPMHMFFGVLTAIFLQASAFALNDYFDYEVDLANKRIDRPLVRGELSRKTALILSIILFPIGIFFAYLINLQAFILALIISILGLLYDFKLKEFGVAGNIYIGFTMCAPFIFGGVIAGDIGLVTAVLSLMAFLSGVAREIMKGIEDVEGDSLRDVKTVARTKGIDVAGRISAALFLISVVISPIPFLFINEFFLDLKYLIPVLFTDIILIKIAHNLLRGARREDISKYRKQSLLAMALGLVGFLVGAF
ncbi:geranylgeranylglycerol-phosphate geranylgeranyltransferase [Archaeoglobus sulfaticallidus PM70-1]|uniref:Geranylgeranylglycerol-phosphate geranylgeranyltransferase n=1 Tax=Archaeoglobus sulfaticallidus PM70-1 TaxID=387631 RepID=N0BJ27_9EURY|nr:UbiA family prenyltransferase [Archaeoglobus sulfaticallidus]AGK60466.1 geranylgeranylglycerol-phosphate geranylgeranyltransferase [Archaeoglobus sulfaticallidus PM70-1]